MTHIFIFDIRSSCTYLLFKSNIFVLLSVYLLVKHDFWQSKYVFVHVSIIIWKQTIESNIANFISQQNFVDQILISKSSYQRISISFFTRLLKSIHLFIARLWYAKLNKHSHFQKIDFETSNSDFKIFFEISIFSQLTSAFESSICFENFSKSYLVAQQINNCFLFRW